MTASVFIIRLSLHSMQSLLGAALMSVLSLSISNALPAQVKYASAPLAYEEATALSPPPISKAWLLPVRSNRICAGRKVFPAWLFLAAVVTVPFLILKCMRSLGSGSSKRGGLKERFLATGGTGPCHPSGADGGGDEASEPGATHPRLRALQLTGADLACLTAEEVASVSQAREELEALLLQLEQITCLEREAEAMASELPTAVQAGDQTVMGSLGLAEEMVQQKKQEAEEVKKKRQDLKNRLQSFDPTPEQRERARVLGVRAFLGGRMLTPGAASAIALAEMILTGGQLGSSSLTKEETQFLREQTALTVGSTTSVVARLGMSPSPLDADVIKARELLEKLGLLVFVLEGAEMELPRRQARGSLMKLKKSWELARFALSCNGRDIDTLGQHGQESASSTAPAFSGPVLPPSGLRRSVCGYQTLQRPLRRPRMHPGPLSRNHTLPRRFAPKAFALKTSTPKQVPPHVSLQGDPGPKPPGQLPHPGPGGPDPLIHPPADPQEQAGQEPGPRGASPRGFGQQLSSPPSGALPLSKRRPTGPQKQAPSALKPPLQSPAPLSGLRGTPASLPTPPLVSVSPQPRPAGPPGAGLSLSMPALPPIDEEPPEGAGPLPPPLPPPEDVSEGGDSGGDPSNSFADYQPQSLPQDPGGNYPDPADDRELRTSSEEDTDKDSDGSEAPGDDNQLEGPPDDPDDKPPDPRGGDGQPHPPLEDHGGDPSNPDGGDQQQPPPPEDSGGGPHHPHGGGELNKSEGSSGDEPQNSNDGNQQQPPCNPGGGAQGGDPQQPSPNGSNDSLPPAPPPADPVVLATQPAASGDGLNNLPPPPPAGDAGTPPPSDGGLPGEGDPPLPVSLATGTTQLRATLLQVWAGTANFYILRLGQGSQDGEHARKHFEEGRSMLLKEKQTSVEGGASPESIQELKDAIVTCEALLKEFETAVEGHADRES